MEMHQVRYFLAVAETLNFTRAAEVCHVAQPSLSRAIGKLEEELGADLFRRERNRTHLTELGRQMLPVLRQVFESAEAAKMLASNLQRLDRAPLRIGLSHTIHLDLIAPMLTELASAFPGLEIHILRGTAPEVLGLLENGDIELGIAAGTDPEWDRLDHWAMFEEDFALLAPSDRANSSLNLSVLKSETVIVRPYCETLATPEPSPAVGAESVSRRHVATMTRMRPGWSDRDWALPSSRAVRRSFPAGLSSPSRISIRRGRFASTALPAVNARRSPGRWSPLLRAADWSARFPS